MTAPDVLLTIKPAAGSGLPLGLGDWRLAVEIMLPEPGATRWGSGTWGSGTWRDFAWYDVTPYVRGLSWQRGTTEFDGNPEIGECQISLTNTDRAFSPWNTISSFQNVVLPPVLPIVSVPTSWGSALWGAPLWGGSLPFTSAFQPGFLGCIMRVVAHSPTGMVNPTSAPGTLLPASTDSWVPQFTGVVESWPEHNAGNGADSQVDITLVETATMLAQIDINALPSVQGDGDLPGARLQRLGAAASWPLGYTDALTYDYIGSAQYALQSTDMAVNRWGECILTGESVGAVVRTDRNGSIGIYNKYRAGDRITRGPEKATTTLPNSAYNADSQIIVENTDNIINDVGLARAGGLLQRVVNDVSIGAFRRRSLRRSDYIGKSDALLLEYVAPRILNARALCSRRLGSIELHSGRALAAQIALDVHDRIDVQLPPLGAQNITAADCTIDRLDHSVTVTAHGLDAWQSTVAFGAQSVFTTY